MGREEIIGKTEEPRRRKARKVVATLLLALAIATPAACVALTQAKEAPPETAEMSCLEDISEDDGRQAGSGQPSEAAEETIADSQADHADEESTLLSETGADSEPSSASDLRSGRGTSTGAASSTGTSPATESQSAQSEAPRHWVEEHERVWVVDVAAWTEHIPVYKTVERSICYICGEDITGRTSAHSKQHMLAGEGSGYHSEVRQVQTGTQAVEHPEEGHWETIAIR